MISTCPTRFCAHGDDLRGVIPQVDGVARPRPAAELLDDVAADRVDVAVFRERER